ncbi:MAG TPA: DNA-binding domain-containing protein [Burkholderiales bacterium]
MPALFEVQRAFARALLREDAGEACAHIADDGFGAAGRLRIYRNTCRSTLAATLRLTYPAVEKLVGSGFFEHVAAQYVACHPARSGYLNDYGGEFVAFLAGLGAARELPYLPDVARFEWALSVAANAADAPKIEPTVLLLVDAERHGDLRFTPHPSVSCLELTHPADEIADAVMSGDDAAMAEVDIAARPVHLIVHRGHSGIETERCTARQYGLISRLCAGEALGRVIEAAPEQAPMILAQQLAKGRFSAFTVTA